MAVWMRVWPGIRSHLPARWPEWMMGGAALAMAAVLTAQPNMFDLAPHYGVIAGYASEEGCATAVLLAGAFRLLALGVNGTFESFRYSPHLRVAAALVGAMFWGLFTLGFVVSYEVAGTSLGPVVPWGILAVIETINAGRASWEMGQHSRRMA